MSYLPILIGYALLMVVLGVVASRRVRATSDFFVAGRGLGTGLIFSTLLAANIGGGSTVGATGLAYRDGLSAWWWVGSAGIGSLILALTVGPKIWRVAREGDLYTVGDYLERRYDRRLRGLVAVLLWIGSLTILAGQLIAIAWILNVTLGLKKWVGCSIGAAVVTGYFAAGGLHAAARVNVLQLVVKLAGFGLVLAYLLGEIGGWPGRSPLDSAAYLDFTGIGAAGVFKYLVVLTPSFIVSPGLLQKIFGARDESAVRRGVLFNALALLAFAIVPALLGIIAHSRFPDLPHREMALPTLLVESLPVWLGGLLLGAIFSAEVSAADAVLFMLSTSLTRDLYQAFINPEADDARIVKAARIAAILCGAIGAGLAIQFETVISALTIFYTLLPATLLLPLLAGLYSSRVTARAALAALIVSVGATMLIELSTRGAGLWGLPPLIWGTAGGLAAMSLAGLFDRRP